MDDQRIDIPDSDDKLLAQCDVDTFRAGGPGGQHQNTTDSAVRLRHRPSGVVVTCRKHRSQFRNKQDCLAILRERLAKLNERPAKRRATRPSRAAKQRRLDAKRKQSARKRDRRGRGDDGW